PRKNPTWPWPLSGLTRQNVTMQPTIGCVLLKFVLSSKLRAAGERVPRTPTLSSIALAKIAHQGSPNEPVFSLGNEFLDAAVVAGFVKVDERPCSNKPWRFAHGAAQ